MYEWLLHVGQDTIALVVVEIGKTAWEHNLMLWLGGLFIGWFCRGCANKWRTKHNA